MSSQFNQRTFAEKAELWLKVQKQQLQQQQRQQNQVEQQHHEQQLDQKPQQQLAVWDQKKVMTFAEQAEVWYKKQCSQQQPKYDQHYSQEQHQKQHLQQKAHQPLQQERQLLHQNKQYEHKGLQAPGLSGQDPIQTPGLTGQGPTKTPGMSGQGPFQTLGLTGQGPIQTPGMIGQGPTQTPGLSGQGPIQTLGPTGQDPIQTPGLSGQGPIQTPGLTGQGPISANKVSPRQHSDAHSQGRLSAQMSPTQAYLKDHFQQHPKQHTGVDERQPTDSPHDLPQSSLMPDAMSMLPSVSHLQKRTRFTKTSSTFNEYNEAENPVWQDLNDGSHPETNVRQEIQNLSPIKNATKKREQPLCLKKKKEQGVSFLHNPRRGQIMKQDVSEMEAFCCWEKIIGKGSYGTVCKAKIDNKEEIGEYVIKKILVAEYDDFRMKSYEREIIHGRILHPHIVPIIAWAEDMSKGVVYLMYPFMENGSVFEKIEEENKGNLLCKKDITNSKIWLRCFYQVSQALDYLHKPGKNDSRGPVFHRDLTSRNILFDEDFNVKICDFGIAVEAKHHASNATATPLQFLLGCHSQSMDPNRYRAYDDVYSFCVLVLEILTGEVMKKEEPFKKYKMKKVLLQAIKSRAAKIEVARWPDDSLRDHLAKKAWEVILLDATGGKAKMTAADFFKDVRVETYKRYQQPKNPNRCVLCYINPTAKNLPLMGEECKGHIPPCAMYCIHCLSDHHNQLVCPLHGPSRPPFGDHVYGVFVAGNHVKHFQDKNELSLADIAGIFTSDAKKFANILKFPLVLGIRNEHLEVVTPRDPGKDDTMVDNIKEAFNKIDLSIRKALTENQKNPDKDRLENSLFIFYFTGHCSKEIGLYLGSERETISASTEWLKKMLCETLRVDQVLVILDCCHAAEQNFARKKEVSQIGIIQLSSCDKDEESICKEEDLKGSVFTHFLCQALQGDNFVETEGQFKKLCKHCVKGKKKYPFTRSPCVEFHLSCSDRQSVTLSSVKDYIRGHYKLHGIELKLKEHCDDADEIHLGYYKPEMSSISICFKEAQNGDMYSISSHPESMSNLKLCMVRYIEDKKIQCQIQGMLEFYRKLSQNSAVEKTSSLIAIHPVAERKAKELINLEDLWKITPCGRALEAKIRDNVAGLKLGSNVKLYCLKRAMTSSLEQDRKYDGLKISKEYIHVQVNLIEVVIEKIICLRDSESEGDFSQEFKELLKNLQEILLKVFCNGEGTVLVFQLYDEFSVVEITEK
ncbi:hypothetical protein CHS0354_013556 [Potamilus streckersoni]|uniref:Protein kinase domain-containing protein n=1 Tax=Potamilus streckersoni TaxID=2493646 RepID=A0AAE0SKH2_9BIVA|nr:hypothetical protein CHS0354_013556 [Potamilus streckersoni]